MKHARTIAVSLALLLGACETLPGAATPGMSSPAAIPSTPISLGDWRNASEAATLQAFEQGVMRRYDAGLPIAAVSSDLRRNDFNCGAAPPRAEGNRGDPPAQVCRKTTTANGCTHTWQVHLFADGEALTRPRGLYDRRCGNDGLLGGPG
ncbi:MAG: hypothetical protein KDA35_03895 [Hyphomonadaceae bacterium]|nr:hypothetical protein [Hyphomonadaceae bacterium]